MTDETLLTFCETSAKVGLGRTSIYAGIASGTFPAPVKVGTRSLWVASELDQWIADRIAERDMGQNMGRSDAA
ncbi:MAG TPA: AlpA family phage regulatory protein [Rhodanobacteraceae bacterium]|nr:AlpA family phage regulatory protein [Rhodanobacteraceae bacterium]